MTNQRSRTPFDRGKGPPAQRGGGFKPQGSSLPKGYLENGYFDDAGQILPYVIVDWPRSIAANLDRDGLKHAQLRNFFKEARSIENQLKAGGEFESLRGRILKLDAFAANAVKKDNAPWLFKQFIENNLKWASRSKKDYVDGFINHFECIVGYYPKK